ncbi:L-asparaginase [Citrobacter murliniae]|uniref:L-asparaginase n=1 Tax=Citrobacter murliniae TaxID=67829 RepID=A0ABY2Q1M5_9ENTR|nr:L-asparaginase [Citrobacter murliniae]
MFLASLNLGSARNPHVLRVRSGCCALSMFKLAATITPNRAVLAQITKTHL